MKIVENNRERDVFLTDKKNVFFIPKDWCDGWSYAAGHTGGIDWTPKNSDMIEVTAVEDADYYADRPAGDVHLADEPRKLGSGVCAVCSICSGCTKEHFHCRKCECKS